MWIGMWRHDRGNRHGIVRELSGPSQTCRNMLPFLHLVCTGSTDSMSKLQQQKEQHRSPDDRVQMDSGLCISHTLSLLISDIPCSAVSLAVCVSPTTIPLHCTSTRIESSIRQALPPHPTAWHPCSILLLVNANPLLERGQKNPQLQ